MFRGAVAGSRRAPTSLNLTLCVGHLGLRDPVLPALRPRNARPNGI